VAFAACIPAQLAQSLHQFCSLWMCSVASVSSLILQPVDLLSWLSLFINFASKSLVITPMYAHHLQQDKQQDDMGGVK